MVCAYLLHIVIMALMIISVVYTVLAKNYHCKSCGVFGSKQDGKEDAAQQTFCELE